MFLGFEFDGNACYRKGARLGPAAIREASANIETYSPYSNFDTQQVAALDLGNLELGSESTKAWLSANSHFKSLIQGCDLKGEQIRFLVLGGDHSISLEPIVAALSSYPDLLLLQIDAHADLRDGYLGSHYSHASVIRRVWEHFGPNHSLIQYGIRSGTREEFQWMRENKSLITQPDELAAYLGREVEGRPTYLTLDLDYFDPAALPGTGTPEPGGAFFPEFISALRALSHLNLVGADVVELAPNWDESGVSPVLAATCVREILIAMHLSSAAI